MFSYMRLAGGRVRVCAAAVDLVGGLELTEENVEMVLDEIRPYLMAGVALCSQTDMF